MIDDEYIYQGEVYNDLTRKNYKGKEYTLHYSKPHSNLLIIKFRAYIKNFINYLRGV